MKTKYLRVLRVIVAAVLLISMLSVSTLAANKSIEEQMAENSAAWWIANNAGDTATCERLHAANEALAKLAAGGGGSASYNAGNGSWDITHDDGSRTTSAQGGSNGSSNYVSYSTTTTGGSVSGTTTSTYTDSSIDAYKAVGGTDAGLKQSYNNAGSNMSTTGNYGDTVAVTSAANEVSVAKEVLGLTDAQAKQLQADLEFLKQIYESAQADYVQANASGNTAAADEALARMTKAHEDAESNRAKYNYTADANGFEDGGYYHDSGSTPKPTPPPYVPPYVPPTYSITASSGAGGSISPSGVVSVTGGSSRSFSITPSAGYEISRVLVDGKDVGCVSSYTFTSIAGSHTIRAEFTEETLAITASAGVGGSITPSGTAWVAYGGSKTYTIKADTGYEIASVVVDGVNKGAVGSYTFSNVTTAHTISVTFAKLRMKIDAFAGPGGSISPSGTAMVDYGGSKTYSIVPAVGYEIASVVVDGVNKGAVGSYTFSNVTTAHTITATFRASGKVDIGSTVVTDTVGVSLNGGSIKSGYGIMVSVPVTESGVTDVNVTLTYNFGQGKTVTLVKSGSYYVFPKNADSPTKARCIYIPVETADSTYVLSISVTAKNAAGETVYDSDTAAVVVKGSMYEDDFTGDS